MKHAAKRVGLAVAALGLMAWAQGSASAQVVNVLWYTGGVSTSTANFSSYSAALASLAAAAPSAPGGNTWNITQWASGPEPVGTFNVLVTASPEGPWNTASPSYAALQAAAPSITLGDRVMLTGQDADWHYMNTPGPANFNGPKGFLLDAINWAGSGTGLGAVFLGTYTQTGFTFTGETQTSNVNQDDVRIPAAFASFPINTGLTSTGLSNWGQSSHSTYSISDTTQWTGINTVGASTTSFVTIVSGPAGGGISVPEPSIIALACAAAPLGLFVAWRRRKGLTV
jgi:hypothetical protein